MVKTERTNLSNRINYIYILLFILVLIAGLRNSADYFNFIGLSVLNFLLELSFYALFGVLFFLLIINNLLIVNRFSLNTVKYWIVLFLAVFLKFFILFVQSPAWVLPGGRYFFEFYHTLLILFLMVLIVGTIRDINGVKNSVWGIGIGAAIAGVLPVLLFPEMIGDRSILVQGYHFSGGFWNAAVISYMSIGWLTIAVSTIEKSKFKRFFLFSLFLIMAFGGIAGLSRATLLSVVISFGVYLLFIRKFKMLINITIIGVIIVALTVVFFPELTQNFSERMEGGINIEEEARTDIWLDYLEDLPDYFLFGAIDGNYTIYSKYGMGPHSALFNWLVQYGILGLLGYIILIIGLIISIKKIGNSTSMETTAALYAWLTAYVSVAFINQTGFNEMTAFIAFGIIFAWSNINENINLKTENKLKQ